MAYHNLSLPISMFKDWGGPSYTPPPREEISDKSTGNLTRLNPAAPLVTTCFPPPPPCILPMVESPQTADSRARKAPSRQSRSCKVCRLRKVKVL